MHVHAVCHKCSQQSNARRYLCYSKAVQQQVQVDRDGRRQPNVQQGNAGTSSGAVPAQHGDLAADMPSGYAREIYEQRYVDAARVKWSPDQESVEVSGHQELKWTAEELLLRAKLMAKEAAELEKQAKLSELSPSARAQAYERLQKQLKALAKKRGVRGLPCFSRLSYFRCASYVV